MDPDEIDIAQAAWARNCSLRGGKPQTRPAMVERLVLPIGIVQGASYYSFSDGMLILAIAGRLYRVQAAGNEFTYYELVDPLHGPNSAFLPECWMQETNGSFIVQDGQSDAIIYDGNLPRRAIREQLEVPLGRQMAYGNGRLYVAVNGNELVAGDIETAAYQSELKFTETTYLLGGGAFYFPRKLSALAFLPRNDTATGYGNLTVFGNDFAKAVRSTVPRDLWATTDEMVTDVLNDIGAISHGSIVAVNQDLYFRDGEGQIRSLRGSRVDQQSPGNAPLSREVSRIVDHEATSRLATGSGIYFDNRLLLTASPFINSYNNTSFKHLVSLDFAPLAGMRGKSPPAYDGQWEGLSFQRLVKGKLRGTTRAFAITTAESGENRLWEIMPQQRADASVFSSILVTNPIRASVEYRRFHFDAKGQRKRLERCDIYLSKIDGPATVTVYWRADGSQAWIRWDEFTVCAQTTDAEGAEPHTFKNLVPQHRAQMRTLTIPDAVNDITQHARQIGFDFQIKLGWTGALQIDRVVLGAKLVDSPEFANRDELPADCSYEDVTDDETDYAIPQAT